MLFCQPEKASGGSGSTEYSGGARDVPTGVVMGRVHGVSDAALGFDADGQGVQEIAARDGFVFRQGKDRRGHGSCGMNDRTEVGVVEVEHVGAHSVGERRVHHVEAVFTSEDSGLRRSGERGEGRKRPLHGFMMRSADSAGHPIEQRARRFPADRAVVSSGFEVTIQCASLRVTSLAGAS